MKVLSSLDPKDRRMLLSTLGLVALLLVLMAFVNPRKDSDQDPTPDSYLSGTHGAKAAFTLLQKSGYSVQRWSEPLSELAASAGAGTVVILAEPKYFGEEDRVAVASILRKGGRVLTTGFEGGLLLPGNEVTSSPDVSFAACEAQPDGIGPLTSPGSIWIIPAASWKETRPDVHTAYACAGQPVVVEYPVGKGTAVWWASSTPLENKSIARGENLALFLNSVGPANVPVGQRVYWDESLHSPPSSEWSFVQGPVWPLLLFGSLGLMLLIVLSNSRRSGPVRALPQTPRTTPIEFLEALGSLYRSTGAAATAMQIAWDRFRTQSALLTGQRTAQLNAAELTAAIQRRFGAIGQAMQPDLLAAEEACGDESLKPKRALALVQALRRHEESLRSASFRPKIKAAPQAGVTLGAKPY